MNEVTNARGGQRVATGIEGFDDVVGGQALQRARAIQETEIAQMHAESTSDAQHQFVENHELRQRHHADPPRTGVR